MTVVGKMSKRKHMKKKHKNKINSFVFTENSTFNFSKSLAENFFYILSPNYIVFSVNSQVRISYVVQFDFSMQSFFLEWKWRSVGIGFYIKSWFK